MPSGQSTSAIPFAEKSASIPAFTHIRAWEKLRDEIQGAMLRVMTSGSLILGPEVNAFEEEFARFVGAEHGIGTASGTDALIVALRALGVNTNDEVLTVANGPVAPIAAIRSVGAYPRFVDIDPVTLQMSVIDLRKSISRRTRCIIPIHLYGQAAPIREILEIADSFGVPVIEDCAQAHGTRVFGQHMGSFGRIGCFSFYPTKNLGAFGDAGLCVTNDTALAQRIREVGLYGFRGRERIAFRDGHNARLDELQAAFLRIRLKYLPDDLVRRQLIACRYRRGLESLPMSLPVVVPESEPSWHQFVLRTPRRDELCHYLSSHGIESGIHYKHPVHCMPAFKKFSYSEGSLPHTEQACRDVISLPMFPELLDEEIDRVVSACKAFGQEKILHESL